MISINEAIKQKINKLRKPHWANKKDHIELYLIPNTNECGPWIKFYSEMNESCGFNNPNNILILEFDVDKKEWLHYQEIKK